MTRKVTSLLIAALTILAGSVEAQTKESPLLLYKGDRSTPPRKVYDHKLDLSDLTGVQTHAGVLIFEITVLPSGRVTDIRLAKAVEKREPWRTLVERCRSAISEWHYEPATMNKKPVRACLTVTVIVHVT